MRCNGTCRSAKRWTRWPGGGGGRRLRRDGRSGSADHGREDGDGLAGEALLVLVDAADAHFPCPALGAVVLHAEVVHHPVHGVVHDVAQ